MSRYVVLLRGINVGGKNTVPMAALKKALGNLGYTNISSYINSGNVVLDSTGSAKQIAAEIEQALPAKFKLDSELIKVLVLTKASFKKMVGGKPDVLGNSPENTTATRFF